MCTTYMYVYLCILEYGGLAELGGQIKSGSYYTSGW